jgi:hypothetical protein
MHKHCGHLDVEISGNGVASLAGRHVTALFLAFARLQQRFPTLSEFQALIDAIAHWGSSAMTYIGIQEMTLSIKL